MNYIKKILTLCIVFVLICTNCFIYAVSDFKDINVGGSVTLKNWTPVNYDVNDDIIFNNTKNKVVDVTVSYTDNFSGYFWLSYKDVSGVRLNTEGVFSNKTGAVAKKTFRIYDGAFKNEGAYNSSSGDFALIYCNEAVSGSKPSNFDSLTPEEQAKYDNMSVLFVDVKVYECSALSFESSTEKVGNMFFEDETKAFNLSYKSPIDVAVNAAVTYEVLDYNKEYTVGETQTRTYRFPGGKTVNDTVILTLNKYGVYFLHVSVEDNSGKVCGEWYVPFSISLSSDTVNYDLGINAHINDGYTEEFLKGLETLKKAGFGRLRHGYTWNQYYESGNKVPEQSQTVLDTASNLGYKTTMVFRGNNDYLYGNKDAGGNVVEGSAPYMPKATEQKNGFANYVYESLNANSDKISVAEIWNEPDMAMYKYNNSKAEDDPEYEYGPEVYAALLKAVYEKVKPDFKSIEIGGVSACEVDGGWYDNKWTLPVLKTDFDDSFFKTDYAYNYLDKVTIHHYSKKWNNGKDCHDTMEAIQTLENSINDIKLFGKVNPKFHHTEFGVSSTASLGKMKQASRLSQYLLSLRAYRPNEEYFIYNFTNNGDLAFNPYNTEANFGITESSYYDVPYAAKPSFVAIANMNSLIGGLDEASIVSSENEIVYSYSSSDGAKTVYAFYLPEKISGNYDLTSVVSKYVNKPVYAYVDMYGNKIDVSSGSVSLSNEVIYAVCDSEYVAPETGNTFAEYERKTITYTEGENGIVYVDAYFPEMEDAPLAVKVFNESGEMVQVNQVSIGDSGLYSFAYRETSDETYSLWFGGKSFSGVYITSKNSENGAFIFVESEKERQITNHSEWNESENIRICAQLDAESYPDCSIFCIGYSEGKLISEENLGIGDMNFDVAFNRYYTDIDKTSFEGADEIGIFVFKSNGTLIPLSRSIKLR